MGLGSLKLFNRHMQSNHFHYSVSSYSKILRLDPDPSPYPSLQARVEISCASLLFNDTARCYGIQKATGTRQTMKICHV